MAATTSSALDHSTFYPNKVDKHASALSSFDAQDLTAKKSDLQQSTQALPQQQQQQANQPLPGHVKTFAQILASVGYMSINEGIYQKLRSIYPLVRSSPELITPAEWNLANLYKCDVYHHGCYFTTSSEHAFLDHLSSEHPTLSLFCFYCTKSGHGDSCHNVEGHSQFSQPEQLVEHIKSQHKDISYQCNLCFYRAFSADHVFMHQATEHLANFEQTLKRAIVDKGDELSPIEREFVQQTTDNDDDDDTEVEDNDDEDECRTVSSNKSSQQISELCKIIACGTVDTDRLNALTSEYFHQHALGPNVDNKKSTSSLVHCVYCPIESVSISSTSRNGSVQSEDFWVHLVTSHPDLPVLAYDFSSTNIPIDLKSRLKKLKPDDIELDAISDLNAIDDELAERIVSNFREQLAINSLSQPSYEETLMKNAFDYYETLDNALHSPSKGTKRKRDIDTTDGPSDGEGTVAAESWGSKRRRLFGQFTLSPSALQKTKRVAGAVATAVVAFGFYHLTHFLPDSVQSFLN